MGMTSPAVPVCRPVARVTSGGSCRGCRSRASVPWTLSTGTGARSGTTLWWDGDMRTPLGPCRSGVWEAQPLAGPDQVGVGPDDVAVERVEPVPGGAPSGEGPQRVARPHDHDPADRQLPLVAGPRAAGQCTGRPVRQR